MYNKATSEAYETTPLRAADATEIEMSPLDLEEEKNDSGAQLRQKEALLEHIANLVGQHLTGHVLTVTQSGHDPVKDFVGIVHQTALPQATEAGYKKELNGWIKDVLALKMAYPLAGRQNARGHLRQFLSNQTISAITRQFPLHKMIQLLRPVYTQAIEDYPVERSFIKRAMLNQPATDPQRQRTNTAIMDRMIQGHLPFQNDVWLDKQLFELIRRCSAFYYLRHNGPLNEGKGIWTRDVGRYVLAHIRAMVCNPVIIFGHLSYLGTTEEARHIVALQDILTLTQVLTKYEDQYYNRDRISYCRKKQPPEMDYIEPEDGWRRKAHLVHGGDIVTEVHGGGKARLMVKRGEAFVASLRETRPFHCTILWSLLLFYGMTGVVLAMNINPVDSDPLLASAVFGAQFLLGFIYFALARCCCIVRWCCPKLQGCIDPMHDIWAKMHACGAKCCFNRKTNTSRCLTHKCCYGLHVGMDYFSTFWVIIMTGSFSGLGLVRYWGLWDGEGSILSGDNFFYSIASGLGLFALTIRLPAMIFAATTPNYPRSLSAADRQQIRTALADRTLTESTYVLTTPYGVAFKPNPTQCRQANGGIHIARVS